MKQNRSTHLRGRPGKRLLYETVLKDSRRLKEGLKCWINLHNRIVVNVYLDETYAHPFETDTKGRHSSSLTFL